MRGLIFANDGYEKISRGLIFTNARLPKKIFFFLKFNLISKIFTFCLVDLPVFVRDPNLVLPLDLRPWVDGQGYLFFGGGGSKIFTYGQNCPKIISQIINIRVTVIKIFVSLL